MPLDGFRIKVTAKDSIAAILAHPRIQFRQDVNPLTGEVYPNSIRYKGEALSFRHGYSYHGEEYIIIDGNFYRYLHGLHNIRPFTLKECREAVDKLCKEFNLRAEEVSVIKLEVGFNLYPSVSPQAIMDNIITYKGRIKNFKDYLEKGYENRFPFNEYELKIYCKSCQHRREENILRVELAAQKSSYLKKFGIETLADLKEKEKIAGISKALFAHIDDFIFDDRSLEAVSLKKADQEVLLKYRDPLLWKQLQRENPELFRKKKPRFRKIIETFGRNNWRQWFKEQLEESLEKQLYDEEELHLAA